MAMSTVIPTSKRGRAYRYGEVAAMLNVSRRTIEREVERGRLKADTLSARVKRIFDDSIDAYVNRTRGDDHV
jgi:excisionase family DNA binding protein